MRRNCGKAGKPEERKNAHDEDFGEGKVGEARQHLADVGLQEFLAPQQRRDHHQRRRDQDRARHGRPPIPLALGFAGGGIAHSWLAPDFTMSVKSDQCSTLKARVSRTLPGKPRESFERHDRRKEVGQVVSFGDIKAALTPIESKPAERVANVAISRRDAFGVPGRQLHGPRDRTQSRTSALYGILQNVPIAVVETFAAFDQLHTHHEIIRTPRRRPRPLDAGDAVDGTSPRTGGTCRSGFRDHDRYDRGGCSSLRS